MVWPEFGKIACQYNSGIDRGAEVVFRELFLSVTKLVKHDCNKGKGLFQHKA